MSKRAKRTIFGQMPDSGVFGRGGRLALRCIASHCIVLQCDALRCVAFHSLCCIVLQCFALHCCCYCCHCSCNWCCGCYCAIGAATATATATGVCSLLVLTTTPVGFKPNLPYVWLIGRRLRPLGHTVVAKRARLKSLRQKQCCRGGCAPPGPPRCSTSCIASR